MNPFNFALWPPGLHVSTARRRPDCVCQITPRIPMAAAKAQLVKHGIRALDLEMNEDADPWQRFLKKTLTVDFSFSGRQLKFINSVSSSMDGTLSGSVSIEYLIDPITGIVTFGDTSGSFVYEEPGFYDDDDEVQKNWFLVEAELINNAGLLKWACYQTGWLISPSSFQISVGSAPNLINSDLAFYTTYGWAASSTHFEFSEQIEDAISATKVWTAAEPATGTLAGVAFWSEGTYTANIVLDEEYLQQDLEVNLADMLSAAEAHMAQTPIWFDSNSALSLDNIAWTVEAFRSSNATALSAEVTAATQALATAEADLAAANPALTLTIARLTAIRDAAQQRLDLAQDANLDPTDPARLRFRLVAGVSPTRAYREAFGIGVLRAQTIDYQITAQAPASNTWSYADNETPFLIEWREAEFTVDRSASAPTFAELNEEVTPTSYQTSTASPPSVTWRIKSTRRRLSAPATTGLTAWPVGPPTEAKSFWETHRTEIAAEKRGFIPYTQPPRQEAPAPSPLLPLTIYRVEKIEYDEPAESNTPGEHGWYFGPDEEELDENGDPIVTWRYKFLFDPDYDYDAADAAADANEEYPPPKHPPPEMLSVRRTVGGVQTAHRSFAHPGRVESETERRIGSARLLLSDPWTEEEFEEAITSWFQQELLPPPEPDDYEDSDPYNPRPDLPAWSPPMPSGTAPYSLRYQPSHKAYFALAATFYRNLFQRPTGAWNYYPEDEPITWEWKRIVRDFDSGTISVIEESQNVTYPVPVYDTKYDMPLLLPAETGNILTYLTPATLTGPWVWGPPRISAVCPEEHDPDTGEPV